MASKKIIIDRSKCISCGSCVACGEGKIKFIAGKAWSNESDYTDDQAQDIIDVCPVDAIKSGDENEYKKSYEDQEVAKAEEDEEDC